ncbi:nitrilase-related carbon-nitrogen hydrolase [Desulfotomaculum copahuensis]|uniref:Nitrilase n=1 Tax=Desulfotomaculum copahuensis TaxID=1838280 RepID=A0A1B7LH31_9FIRM|nr:nitrilase-related carbon-nitrogen hydrolase [Desulfotomaculum copahuensis]OAT85510.1 nitrilase [Desulfotomaculum copahuensis]
MQNTRLALVQMRAKTGLVKENLDKIEHFVALAAREKADLICFPELCVPGYHRELARQYTEVIPGPGADRLSRLARDTGVTVLAGLAEQSECDRPYITHLVAHPDGRVQKYRKTHLGKSECPHFTAGNELPVFQTEKTVFGVEICWDLHFPEVTTVLSLRGAEIIFAPHASPVIVGDRRAIWLKYLAARAYDNAVFVAACNLVGRASEKQEFCGGAMVLDPRGDVLAEDFSRREGMLLADLDATLINTIRRNRARSMRYHFYLNFRRPELYRELLRGAPDPPPAEENKTAGGEQG